MPKPFHKLFDNRLDELQSQHRNVRYCIINSGGITHALSNEIPWSQEQADVLRTIHSIGSPRLARQHAIIKVTDGSKKESLVSITKINGVSVLQAMHLKKRSMNANETTIIIRDIWLAVAELDKKGLVHNAINHDNVFVNIDKNYFV